jgi:hypothetical protein
MSRRMVHPRSELSPMITSPMRRALHGAGHEVVGPVWDTTSDRSVAGRIGLRSYTS